MNNPETSNHLLLSTLADLKRGIDHVSGKVDTLSTDVASLKERHPFYAEKLTHINLRLNEVEEIGEKIQERQNVIYGIAAGIAAIVTFFMSTIKSFAQNFFGS